MSIARRWVVSLLFFSALSFLLSLVPSRDANAEYGDITLNRYAEKAGMPPVVFPHWFHRIRFKCKVCHPAIFEMRAGSNDINMIKIIKGEFCGKCHNGRIAWPPLYCDRCHSGKSEINIPKARGFVK
jgi:c(7)-type cytochrome triheme protein